MGGLPTLRRILRLAALLFVAMVAYQLLEPLGAGFWVPIGLAVFFGLYAVWTVLRYRKAKAEEALEARWTEALVDPARRPAMRSELKTRRARIDKKRTPRPHARLSLLYAELLDADGDRGDARRALAEVERTRLGASMLATVQHARSTLSLADGDLDDAEMQLELLPAKVDPVMTDRIALLRASIALERGDGEAALEVARRVREDTRDPDVRVEARMLKATALDAMGDAEDAMKVLRAFDAETLEALSLLGLPRIKALAVRAKTAAGEEAATSA